MLFSELEFGSYLTYTPRGDSDLAKRSRYIRTQLKLEGTLGDPPKFMSQLVAEKIKLGIDKLPFKHFLGPRVSLVPVPKSSLIKENSLWVPKELAKALSNQGLGGFYPCLKRIFPLQKSSYSIPSNRPKPLDHYNSIKCQPLINKPEEILLIDDVITRGSTLLGCASRIKEIFPSVPIRAFAALRTISDPDDFIKIEDPCIGKITLNENGWTHRRP